jgi:hypothetical protein
MDMAERYVARVCVDELGDPQQITALDNVQIQLDNVLVDAVPPELMERIALLRLCDVNKKKGEVIGRKFSENVLYVYLSYSEYKSLTNKECANEFTK